MICFDEKHVFPLVATVRRSAAGLFGVKHVFPLVATMRRSADGLVWYITRVSL